MEQASHPKIVYTHNSIVELASCSMFKNVFVDYF